MVDHIEAVYENGLLRPLTPLDLNESDRVLLSILKSSADPLENRIDHDFVAYARAEVAKLKAIPTVEEVNQRLAPITGSLAELIIAERGED